MRCSKETFLLCFWRGVSVSVHRLSRIAAFVAFLVFCGQTLLAQGVFGTLDGVVSDPTGAVVPNAKVILTDAGSGSAHDTVTDSSRLLHLCLGPCRHL